MVPVGGGVRLVQSNYGWTSKQVQFVIDYLKEENCYREDGKVKYGRYELIGEKIGKSRVAVKNKVHVLRKAGRL